MVAAIFVLDVWRPVIMWAHTFYIIPVFIAI